MADKQFVVRIGDAGARRDLDRAKELLRDVHRKAGLEGDKVSDAETVRKALRFFIAAHQPQQAYRIDEGGDAVPVFPKEGDQE